MPKEVLWNHFFEPIPGPKELTSILKSQIDFSLFNKTNPIKFNSKQSSDPNQCSINFSCESAEKSSDEDKLLNKQNLKPFKKNSVSTVQTRTKLFGIRTEPELKLN